ncbi:MAG: hypothetical protein JNM43_19740 [Planctomycetaceae bacterium]|nr:hypothetical protein [Planctomycetaceae bacterium]
MQSANPHQESKATGRFWTVAAVLFATGIVWIAQGSSLLFRDLWMDEVHSWLLLTAPTQSHMLSALADGADFNPPGWYLITRWLTAGGYPSELLFRSLSLFWMLLAVVAVWVILARRYSRVIALLAVVAAASHPLIIYQSTEIRFYSFWCATILWLAVCLDWKPNAASMRFVRYVGCGLLAVLTVTTHYFGIISLALVCLPAALRWLKRREGLWDLLWTLVPAISALIAVLPFLRGQRAALTRPTWISPPTLSDSFMFLEALLPYRPILLAALVLAAIRYASTRSRTGSDPDEGWHRGASWELLCLALMPLAIVAFSWGLQPALVTRYALVGLLPVAAVFAPLLNDLSVRWQRVVLCLLLLLGGKSLHETALSAQLEASARADLARQLGSCNDGPVIMEDRIVWMGLLHRHRELRTTCYLVDFSDNELLADSALRVVQRDAGRRIARWFPDYSMRRIADLSQAQKFYVVTYESASAEVLKYPQSYVMQRVSKDVYCFKSVAETQRLSSTEAIGKTFVQKPFDERKW